MAALERRTAASGRWLARFGKADTRPNTGHALTETTSPEADIHQ
jgi:hypothetical protein